MPRRCAATLVILSCMFQLFSEDMHAQKFATPLCKVQELPIAGTIFSSFRTFQVVSKVLAIPSGK